jgi:mono/diheme cytochrome c family protein
MPVLARAFLLIVFFAAVAGGGLFAVASRRVGRIYDVPPSPIGRATASDEIARGGRLFRTNCLDCHAGSTGDAGLGTVTDTTGAVERRPIGGRVTGAPEFMGEIWAPNLTADRDTGIGAFADADIARLLRNGIRRDGRYAATMPRFGRLADADVAALIGFLRSTDPLLAAVSHLVPRPGLGVAGTLALAFAAGVDVRGEPHVAMPPRGPTAAYGRYLASAVYACVDCHTEGFTTTEEKLQSHALLAGGQFHRTPAGETIYSTNLTPDPETGLAVRTAAALARVLTTGVGDDGVVARPPMPVFRAIDNDETEALFAYLRSVPSVVRRNSGPPRERPAPDAAPERLFATLGCAVCHGDRGHQRALLRQAAGHPVADIAASMRHPERRHPQSQMPTYAAVLDEATALRLASWIRATGGGARP